MSRRKKNTNRIKALLSILALLCIGIVCYFNPSLQEYLSINTNTVATSSNNNTILSFNLSSIPDYQSEPYVVLNNNEPNFEDTDLKAESFEEYSELDSLGRCGIAYACLSIDTMPSSEDERGSISSIEPSGWINKEYENVDGGYLYNRCHLIGYQLSNENANEKNLITGTRYMNTEGMLPFENKVADYIKNTNNHVLYRVSPIYEDDNLLASGVQIEASSVEDKCKDICFNVYVYNVEDGIEINYYDGSSKLA